MHCNGMTLDCPEGREVAMDRSKQSMLSLVAAAESVAVRSALLQAGTNISADEHQLRAEQVELTEEFKRREAQANDLRAKLAAAQRELDNLRVRAGLADWQPLTEDDEPVRCPCSNDDCNTGAWIDEGLLILEDADGMRVSFDMGEEYAFVRRVKSND